MKTILTVLFAVFSSIPVFSQINPDEFQKIGYIDMYGLKRSAYYNNNQINYSDSSWFYPALSELGLTHVVAMQPPTALPLSNNPPYNPSFNTNIKLIDNFFARASIWSYNKPYKYSHSAGNSISHFPYEAGGSNIALLTGKITILVL